MSDDLNLNALQKKIFNIVKKKSFTPSNIIRIMKEVLVKEQTGHISSLDIIKHTILLEKTYFSKKISALYRREKVLPKNHRKLNPEKQSVINDLFDEFSSIKGFQIPKEGFEYIINKMITRIGKDVKIENMQKLNISRDVNNDWNAVEYGVSRKLLKKDEVIDYNFDTDNDLIEEEFDSMWKEPYDESIKINELRKAIVNNMGLIKELDFKFSEEMMSDAELKLSVINSYDGDYDKAITLINNGDMSKYIKQMDDRINQIHGMDYTVNRLTEAVINDEEVYGISDDDNDGNTFIASFNRFKRTLVSEKADNFNIKPAKIFSSSDVSHGLSSLHIEHLISTGEINPDTLKVLITFDNGMSLTEKEVSKILTLLPNSELVITDHHLPAENLVREDFKGRVKFCNPKYNPTDYFKGKKNISGAQVGGEILKRVLTNVEKTNPELIVDNLDKALNVIDNNSKFSSIADVIDGDITIYPTKRFDIDRLSGISTSMNVINNMKSFIGNDLNPSEISDLFGIEDSEAEAFTNTLLYLNSISKEYLELFDKLFGRTENSYSINEKSFSKEFADIHKNFEVNDHSENFISQLRPILIELTNDPYKNIFQTKFLEHTEKIFKELKKLQTEVVDTIREKPLNFIEDSKKLGLETERVSILIKKEGKEQRFINRKMLNIALNEANNGYRAILDSVDGNELGGSMRSNFSREDIFEDADEINKKLGIEQKHMGHSTAAGWKIKLQKCKTKEERFEKLRELTLWIDSKLEGLEKKELDRIEKKGESQKKNVYPTDKVSLLLKANTLLRDSFQGNTGISNTIYLDDYQIATLERKIKDSKFGWVTLDTKIMDATLIFPNEVLKKYIALNKEGKKVSLDFSTLTSGSLILNNIRVNNNDNFIEKDSHLDEYNTKYIADNYKKNIEHLSNSDLQKQPYFVFNKYGDIEFQRMQAVIVTLMNRYNLTHYNILDIEGTGLAMTEEIPEISALTLKIHEGSGSTLEYTDFLERSFLSHGREILVDREDLDNLVYLEPEELESDVYDRKYIIYNEDSGKWYFNNSKKHYPEIFSKKTNGNKVVYNQQLIGSHFHAYINDLTENIPTSIESLTHLNNDFIKNSGNSLSLGEADELLYTYFKSMDKALLSAHNLSYDYSLIRSNFPKTFDYMHKEMLLYDTAKTSQAIRIESQQYASIDLPIAIGDLPNPTVKFRNYYGNDLSLEEFFDNLYDGREISDKSGRFLIKISGNNLIFIDKENDLSAILLDNLNELSIDDIKNWLQLKTDVSVAPKYSVQSLLHEKYVKMMLHKIKPIVGVKKDYSSLKELPILDKEFQEFIRKYRFDNGINSNINTLLDYINFKYQHLSLPDGESIVKYLLAKLKPYTPPKGKVATSRAINKHVNDMYDSFITLLKTNIQTFISSNKEISAAYTNRFYAEEVIHLLPENLDRITPEMIKNVSSKTSYSIEFVEDIVSSVQEFAKINGVNVFSIGEVHNNLVGKDTKRMGDVAIEGMLAILHLLNEKYNFLNKTNLTSQAVDFLEKGIIETAKLDFNKRQKEDITTSQINSSTFRIGKKLISLRENSIAQSQFAQKIEDTTKRDTKLLKINERLIQTDTLIYADIPSDYTDKDVDKVVNQIEIFMFLENLKQSKIALESYITNLLEKNTKNFVVNFAHYFAEQKIEFSELIKKRYSDYKSQEGTIDSRRGENYFAVTSIELYSNFNDLLVKLEAESTEIESEVEDMENMSYLSKDEVLELKKMRDKLTAITNFKLEIDKIYEKVTSLNMINELFESVETHLELTQDELTKKYNLVFDYTTANRKSKISNEIFDLLGELQEVERESFSRFYLSPKFVKRDKKPVVPSYLKPEELNKFKTDMLTFIEKELIDVMNLPDEFLVKITEHLNFLLNYYFINEDNIDLYKSKKLDELKEKDEKGKESIQEMMLADFKRTSFSDNPKKFNNPSKEIVQAIEKAGTGLARFIVRTKFKPESTKRSTKKSVKRSTKKKF